MFSYNLSNLRSAGSQKISVKPVAWLLNPSLAHRWTKSICTYNLISYGLGYALMHVTLAIILCLQLQYKSMF